MTLSAQNKIGKGNAIFSAWSQHLKSPRASQSLPNGCFPGSVILREPRLVEFILILPKFPHEDIDQSDKNYYLSFCKTKQKTAVVILEKF